MDHAKRAATKAELQVAKRLRKAPGVLKVHHAVRLTKIEGGKSRREVDLIAVMQDRLVLIEVKNFNGVISMDDDGVLHQNGQSRGWTFAKLDDASKRLKDTMHLTGIRLKTSKFTPFSCSKGKGRWTIRYLPAVVCLMPTSPKPRTNSSIFSNVHWATVQR